MIVIYLIFFTAFFILFYNYIGYGVLLYGLVRAKRLFSKPDDRPAAPFEPPVSLVIAAYNEADFIEQKIHNTLQLDYPSDKLEIIFVTDGSSDQTPDIIAQYPSIRLLHQPQRHGKTAAINRAMKQVQHPVVIFCDANTLLNSAAIKNIVQHYADEKTGGVAGEKKVVATGSTGAAATEGIYWKYESLLKKLDADLYSVVGAAGELFSIRTTLYTPVEEDVILDDFIISLRINMAGYRIAYAPDAYAMEAPSFSMEEEHKRKVRISAGGFQSIVMLSPLLNIFRYPLLAFQYISHRVLRWTLSPLSLPLLLISNIVLVWTGAGIFYQLVLAAQLCFYLAALVGYQQAKAHRKSKLFYIPFYFLFMNIAVYQGFFRYIGKKQSAAWDKAQRSTQTF
ncbi:glycosyltransferase family 2 protein [Chitinophaga qingshengii]|uniref:Glycosyltransferase family 2 protein n=1 Tax=Chitinophaga qingshengii TaxID=1569794 RepID=A0ABR7TH08_9BACT|nr:glycosyltransferase family 2 protein [Chitinophaga qingshengii]MBC9928796.1 glycosyltransferase family 2 protein [Chitinophaga qingshengii]